MEGKNPYADYSDEQLIGEAKTVFTGQGAILAEVMRRLKDTIEEQNREAKLLGNRIWWLNLLLLLFTIGIFLLTVILAWPTIRGILG